MNVPPTPVTFLLVAGTDESDLPEGTERSVRVTDAELVQTLARALVRAAVVAVVPDDEAAHRLLGLGVDEVVRAGVDAAQLEVVEDRARLRARARWGRDAPALGSFVGLFERAVHGAIVDAAINSQAIQLGLGTVTKLADEYARSASSGRTLLPVSERGRIVATRVAAPASERLGEAARALDSTLRSVAVATEQMMAFSPRLYEAPTCDARTVLCAVAQLAEPLLGDRAELKVSLPKDPCPVPLSKSTLADVVAELLERAAAVVSDYSVDQGVVTLALRSDGDTAVIAVSDNGPGGSSAAAAAVSPVLNDYVERVGGAVLIDLELGVGSTARVFLPVAKEYEG